MLPYRREWLHWVRLLNLEQRFQGATAVAITDDEVARLIRAHFPKLQASELKYHALAKRPGYRQPLLDLC